MSESVSYRQAKLISGSFHMVSWIEADSKEGQVVNFKGDPRKWLIEKMYDPSIEKKDIKRDWKVGGL